MAIDTGKIVEDVVTKTKALAEEKFKQYTKQAVADVKGTLEKGEADLKRWTEQLATNKIDNEEFKSLVRGKLDVAEMRALKQAGLAEVQIQSFVNGVIDIVVEAALAAIP